MTATLNDMLEQQKPAYVSGMMFIICISVFIWIYVCISCIIMATKEQSSDWADFRSRPRNPNPALNVDCDQASNLDYDSTPGSWHGLSMDYGNVSCDRTYYSTHHLI